MRVLLFGALLLGLTLAGCADLLNATETQAEEPVTAPRDVRTTPTTTPNYHDVVVSGIGQTRTVSSDDLIRITMSGIDNTIEVLEGSDISRITMSGSENQIFLPRGTLPEITDSGIDNEITYR